MANEEFYLAEDNRTDKSYIPSDAIELIFDGATLKKKREGYLAGKKYGFMLGVEFFKPLRLIKSLDKSSNTDIEKRFFSLLDIFFKRFGLGIAWHPRDGMIFQKIDYPALDQLSLFHVMRDGDFKTISKNELLQNIHLKVEELSNSELSSLSLYLFK